MTGIYRIFLSLILILINHEACSSIRCRLTYAHLTPEIRVLETKDALQFQETNIYDRFIVYSQYFLPRHQLKMIIYQIVNEQYSPIYSGTFKVRNNQPFSTGLQTFYGKQYEREVSFICIG